MSAIPYVARYAVPCGIAPEREGIVERTVLSIPWARGRAYLLAREAARAVVLAGSAETRLRDLPDAALDRELASLRSLLCGGGVETAPWAEALAIAREIAARSLDQRPFDEQLFAAFVLLRGGLAEMSTGEGKTLTASIAGAVAGASGTPVHLFSSNDYLVARDAQAMAPFFQRMGLSVGRVLGNESEFAERSSAYACDVTYLTPRELAFDYLRDRRIVAGVGPLGRRVARIGRKIDPGLRQRGLHFAIVDEADDVLLDQARTPFVLSRVAERGDSGARARMALALARSCVEGNDYVRSGPGSMPRLTDEGAARLGSLREQVGLWPRSSDCLLSVKTALFAINDLTRDIDYVVRGDSVEIVDGPTGRRSPDQSFERGLHQLLEMKEGLDATAPAEGASRIAGQALFRRYLQLSAMTGTAREARAEFWRVYGLPVVRIPLRRPSRRIIGELQCHLDEAARDEAIFRNIEAASEEGRSVLVGTGTVEASRRIATLLEDRGVANQLLNAADDAEEAEIIARAGESGRVTVATNMAGRGTDILLDSKARRSGGLHVICARVGESRRVDRQLLGRCGRQGDPGRFERILSLGDPSFVEKIPSPLLRWARNRATRTGKLNPRIAQILLWGVQMAEENRAEAARRTLLALQSGRDQLLAFAGKSE